ncbi:MAG: polysaccharide pyruvyl transferase family protein [Azoarcus sp.]|nr:polysaccharide pyruvyl transferase family protein [Azoarcus sp.]
MGAYIYFETSLVDIPSENFCASRSRFGIIICGWRFAKHSDSFLNSLVVILKRLIEICHVIHALAFCVVVDKLEIDFFEHNRFKVDSWNPDIGSPSSYIERLNKYKFYISARFHGVVLGVLLGCSSIGIELDQKVSQICAKLGMEKSVW